MALSNSQFVTTAFSDILFNTATHASDISFYTSLLNSFPTSVTQGSVATIIASTAEANIVNYIYSLYTSVLGTALSGNTLFAGIGYWAKQAEAMLTPAQIASGTLSQAAINFLDQSFINATQPASPVAVAATNPSAGAPTVLVNQLYLQGLNSATPDQSGVTYWVNQYNSWVNTLGSAQALVSLINSFANAAQGVNLTSMTGVLSAAAQSDTGSGATYGIVTPGVATANSTGASYFLTTGNDTVAVAINNATINGLANGTGATFATGDTITGGTTTGNTLKIWDLGTAGTTWTPTSLTGVTVSGIQSVNLTSNEAINANMTTAAAGYTGLTTLNITSQSNAAAVDAITVNATTAVTVTDTTAGKAVSGNLTVNGGATVAITENNGNFANSAKTITVNGGSGTTTVSVTQTETGNSKDQAVTIVDANQTGGTKAGVITTVTVDGIDGNAIAVNDSALTNLTINHATSGTVTITEGNYSAPAATLNLNLNADTGITVTDAGSKYNSLSVTTGSTGSALTIGVGAGTAALTTETIAGNSLLTQVAVAMTALTSISVSGAAGLTDTDLSNAALASLASVSSTSSGVITVTLNGTLTSFTGGAGQDIVTINAAPTKALTGGGSGTNEIVLNNAGATWPTLANITNFSTLGVGAGSSGTFDLSVLTGFSQLDALAATGTVVFANVTKGTPLSIDGAATAITYKTSDTSGTTDSLALTIGGSAANAAAYTIGSVTATDSVGTGIDSLIITGYDTTAGAGHTLSTLVDNSLSSLTINGSASETIGNAAFSDMSATLTITNNSTSTAASTVTMTANSLTSLTMAGSGPTTVVLTDTFAGGITLYDTTTAAATFTPTALANITSLTVNDSSTGALTVGSLTDANMTTVTLNNTGGAQLSEGALTVNGLTAANFYGTGPTSASLNVTSVGALTITDSDTGLVNLSLTSTLGTLTINDSAGTISVGAGATTGASVINLTNTGTGTISFAGMTDNTATTVNVAGKAVINLTDSLAGAVSILGPVDNANVTVNLNHSSAAPQSSIITLGNGNDTIIISDSVVGTNATTITIGNGTNSITLLANHTGGDENLVFSAANAASTTVLTTILNAVAGDTITWLAGAPAVNTTINPIGVVTSVAAGMSAATASPDGYSDFITGSRTFIYVNTGSATTSELVALVGVHPLASATTTAGTLA